MEGTCRFCGLDVEHMKPDPCLGGYVPGLAWACCGHGRTANAYLVYGDTPNESSYGRDRVIVRGRLAELLLDAGCDDPLPPQHTRRLAVRFLNNIREDIHRDKHMVRVKGQKTHSAPLD